MSGIQKGHNSFSQLEILEDCEGESITGDSPAKASFTHMSDAGCQLGPHWCCHQEHLHEPFHMCACVPRESGPGEPG